MKKATLLILTYALVVVALVVSVKLTQTYIIHNQAIHEVRLADCDDPPPTPNPGQ
jgi:hypothetical protein